MTDAAAADNQGTKIKRLLGGTRYNCRHVYTEPQSRQETKKYG